MTMKSSPFLCPDCEQPIKAYQWHDCKGLYDLERYAITGQLPRSARKRIAKKYGIGNLTSDIDRTVREEKSKGTMSMFKGRPSAPVEGDVAYDVENKKIEVYVGGSWKNVSANFDPSFTRPKEKLISLSESRPTILKEKAWIS